MVNLYRTLFGLILFGLMNSTLAISQFSAWREKFSGAGVTVGINPLNPMSAYAEGDSGGIYASADDGITWHLLGNPGFQGIRQIIVNPHDTLTIFAAGESGQGLRKSTDYGATWRVVLANLDIDGESITADPTHPDTMYAGNYINGTIHRSYNRGESWTIMGSTHSMLCALAVRPDSTNILYAGSGFGAISKSTDGGTVWRIVKSDSNGQRNSDEIPKIVIDPNDPVIAYATLFGGAKSAPPVWKTTDGGEQWVLAGLPSNQIWALDIDQTNPNVLYVGTFSEGSVTVFKTGDGGSTWADLMSGLPNNGYVWSLKVHPRNASKVWAAISGITPRSGGIFRWMNSNTGIRGIVLDQATGDTVTAGFIRNKGNHDSLNLSPTHGGFGFGHFEGDSSLSALLHCEAYPYYPADTVMAFVPDSIRTADISLRKLARSMIRGAIRDSASGRPITAQLHLFASTLAGNLEFSVATDSEGIFKFDGLFISYPSINDYDKLVVEPVYPYSAVTVAPISVDTASLVLNAGLNPADVLVTSSAASGDYNSYYTLALDSLRLSSYVWNVSSKGLAPLSRAAELRKRAVIYYTGDQSAQLPPAEIDTLVAGLNRGSHIFLTGQNIVEKNNSTSLFKNYLRVGFGGNTNIVYTRGFGGDLFNGFAFYTIGAGANNQVSRDIITSSDPHVNTILGYGPNDTSGIAGIRVDSVGNNGKVILFGFGFEAINGAVTRMKVLNQILGYFDGSIVVTVKNDGMKNSLPLSLDLYQNYPNPFNPSTEIKYDLPQSLHVTLKIYDVLGRDVATLVDGVQDAGYKAVTLNGSSLPSGVFFYRLQVGNFAAVKKMLLIR